MDASPTALVRAGSGFLFVLVGLAVLALSRRRRANVGIGLWAAGLGATTVAYHLLFSDPATATAGLVLAAGTYALGAVGLALLLSTEPLRRIGAAAAFGLAVAAEFIMPVQRLLPPTPAGSPEVRAVAGVLGVVEATMTSMVVVALALAARASDDAAERRRKALLALVVGAAWGFTAGAAFVGPIPFERVGIVFLLGTTAAWIWAAGRVGAPALAVAWGVLGVGVFGMVDDAWFGGSTILGTSLGTAVLRAALAGGLVYGVVRFHLLGYEIAAPTARRGTLATAALVGFFIVAQIAQEFLSDTMGVVLGGVAAGALLFAAVPLQRAAERLVQPPAVQRPAPAVASDAAANAYRAALRAALRDGPFDAEKEEHLAEVAHALGVSYPEALRLRREVTDDVGSRA